MDQDLELPSALVPGKGGQNPLLVGAPLPDRAMESFTDSQALKKRNLNFKSDAEIAEVREYSTVSKEAPPAARCCLAEFCHQLCGALREQSQADKDAIQDEGGGKEAQTDEAFDAETIAWKHSRTAYDGYLWKLNAGTTEEEMADMMSWRRRQFYLQRNQDKLALMYTSEKENGQVQVSCLLSSATTSATISTLKSCTVNECTEQEKNRVVSDLETYDTAFGQKRFDYDYSRDMPSEFHPFQIVSTNEDGSCETIVLSGGNQRMSSRWEQAIGRALQQVKRQSKRQGGTGSQPLAGPR